MNENIINKKNFVSQSLDVIKKNIRNIIIFTSLCFVFFLIYQIYVFYSINKIQNNSIAFFNAQNLNEINEIKDPILTLTNENNFYGILSKLELIQLNIKEEKNQEAIKLYLEILDNNSLNNIYKSAIASKASYQFIDLNLKDITKDYSEIISKLVSYIDDDLETYKGVKLEISFLVKILEAKKNSIKYSNYNEAINLYNIIINSDDASSSIKERINKIHEFFSHK